MGFRQALEYTWRYGWAALRLRAQQIYHLFFSLARKEIRRQQLPTSVAHKPYAIALKEPVVAQRKRVMHAIASFAVGG